MPLMPIRPFEPKDAPRWAEIFHRAVHEIASRHYSPAQCAAWSPAPAPAARVAARADRLSIWVAVDAQDVAQGFIELEPDGHIDCFYVAPEAVGQDVGVALYAHLEAAARAARITRLHVEASEAAKGFFLRQGFALDRRRDFDRHGVAMHHYLMHKPLT